MKVDADYNAKPYSEWKASDWPKTYQNPTYKNIFAVGIAFAPPHIISKPMKSPNGYKSLFVIKKDDEYITFVNARYINQSGEITTAERSPYYPKISADITRFAEITAVYEDLSGKTHYKKTHR